MIELQVDKICHHCTKFKADTNTEFIYGNGELQEIFHVIKCENRAFCKSVRDAAKKAAAANEV